MTTTKHDQPTEGVRLHPLTGELIKPLFTWHGGAVWPVLGGAPEADDTDDDQDGESGTETDTDEGNGDAKEGSDDRVSREDFEKLKRQLQAADKGKSALEKRLKELDDKDKNELQKATERVSELEKEQERTNAELANLRLQNAFLSAETGITWHDPGDALALAERKGYLSEVVGEDGKVDQDKLKAKLKEMAKSSPHLVKSGSEAPKDPGSAKDQTNGRTGSAVGSKGSKEKDKGPDLSRYDRFLNR